MLVRSLRDNTILGIMFFSSANLCKFCVNENVTAIIMKILHPWVKSPTVSLEQITFQLGCHCKLKLVRSLWLYTIN